MGKSRRKTKAMKITGPRSSDKTSRSLANRVFRKRSKVSVLDDHENLCLPGSLKEVSDPWGFPSDGLAHYQPGLPEKYMRK